MNDFKNPLSSEQKERLRELHEKATPGPWLRVRRSIRTAESQPEHQSAPNGFSGGIANMLGSGRPGSKHEICKKVDAQAEANAELIVAMRNALPSLLSPECQPGATPVEESPREALEKLESENDRLRAALEQALALTDLTLGIGGMFGWDTDGHSGLDCDKRLPELAQYLREQSPVEQTPATQTPTEVEGS